MDMTSPKTLQKPTVESLKKRFMQNVVGKPLGIEECNMKKDDLNSLLTYYSNVSRTRNTSISIFFTLLIGWLALVYASIAQEQLLTFESKLVVASTLMILTVYISLRVVNFGFILYRIESMVGLRKPIEEIGSNPKWLDKLNKRRKSLSYFSSNELLGVRWYAFST